MVTQFNNIISSKVKLSYLNDDVFKSFLDLSDEDSLFLTKQFIYLITGLKVDSIKKIDREMNRIIENGKASTVDFIALVDGQYINIEIQKRMNKADLLPKIQMYQSHVMVSQKLQGIQDYRHIPKVITIIFYESIYDSDEQLVSQYEYTCRNRQSDIHNKMSTYLVELGKINQIYQKKQMNMNKLEKICFYIKNNDNEQFYDILKVIEDEEQEVNIMNKKYNNFREDLAEYMTAINAQLNEAVMRSYYTEQRLQEGIEEGIEKGEKKKEIEILTQLLHKKYSVQDISWLQECSTNQLEKALDIIFDDLSFNEFKKQIFQGT